MNSHSTAGNGRPPNTFAAAMLCFAEQYPLPDLFDDLLTVIICTLDINPATGSSFDDALFYQTVEKYVPLEAGDGKSSGGLHFFDALVTALLSEMTCRRDCPEESKKGMDVLGGFYEQYILSVAERAGAGSFLNWQLCEHAAKAMMSTGNKPSSFPYRPLAVHEPRNGSGMQSAGVAKGARRSKVVYDPNCGSARMLLALARESGSRSAAYFGTDPAPVRVKMAAINLYLNRVYGAEVAVLDSPASHPDSMSLCYRIAAFPPGLHRVRNPEDSRLWQFLQTLAASGHDCLTQLFRNQPGADTK